MLVCSDMGLLRQWFRHCVIYVLWLHARQTVSTAAQGSTESMALQFNENNSNNNNNDHQAFQLMMS